MADRAIEDHLPPSTNAVPKSGMKTRLVEADDGSPNRLDVIRTQTDAPGIDLPITPRADRGAGERSYPFVASP